MRIKFAEKVFLKIIIFIIYFCVGKMNQVLLCFKLAVGLVIEKRLDHYDLLQHKNAI